MKPITAFIGVGSNLGNKSSNCQSAIDQVDTLPGYHVIRRSTLFKTEPEGVTGQPWYVNCVAQITAEKDPFELLQELMKIESAMGRVRRRRWEERIIDLDILLFGQEIRKSHNLIIPHPLMHQRRFVLEPLAQLAPDLVHPVLKVSIQELLQNLPIPPYSGIVKVLKEET
ncbi:MAG: 2-amino-4-hydroxy-6-hydroxymethyldihydropteridine diphosphokinase [Thermodesulfobacteriota bacterium]